MIYFRSKYNDLPPPYDAKGFIPQNAGVGDAVASEIEPPLNEKDDLDGFDQGGDQNACQLGLALFKRRFGFV